MKKEHRMIAWVLKDEVTGKFYVDAALTLGDFDEAIILRTAGSKKAGIAKRKTMMRHDIKLETVIKELKDAKASVRNYSDRMNFGKKRAKLPDFGIKAIALNIIPWETK